MCATPTSNLLFASRSAAATVTFLAAVSANFAVPAWEQPACGLCCSQCNDADSATLDGLQDFGDRIMSVTPITEAAGPPVSLRERKKLATRRLLRRAALELVAERGLANVTVE